MPRLLIEAKKKGITLEQTLQYIVDQLRFAKGVKMQYPHPSLQQLLTLVQKPVLPYFVTSFGGPGFLHFPDKFHGELYMKNPGD